MAATHGRLTGRPGVCITTLGPGALNLATGAAYAHLGAMPMIMLTGQKAILTARQARFQIVDIVAAMKPLTKMARQIVSAATIPTHRARGLPRRHGGTARPGAAGAARRHRRPRTCDGAPMVPPHPIELPVANPRALDARRRDDPRRASAADHARRRRQPAALDRRSRRVRRAHADPVLHHADGQGHGRRAAPKLYMGTAALSERDYVHDAIDRADLIIAIGHDTVEKPPFLMGRGGPKVIHVGYTPAKVEEVYFPHAEVVGDIGPSAAPAGRPARGQAPARERAAAAARAHPGHIADRADGRRASR